MRRIRLVFVTLAVLLAVPMTLLLRRAFESVDAERAQRHRLVADRILDEMERELGDLLRREEERPWEHYRSVYLSPETGGPRLSPLAAGSELPFVLAYFQIGPDGEVSGPARPSDREIAASLGWAGDERRAEVVLDEVETAWEEATAAGPASRDASPRLGEESDRRQEEQVASERSRGLRDAGYSVLQKLNRAARDRGERKAKVAPTQAPLAAEFEAAEGAEEAVALREGAPPELVDVRLEPMVGRASGPDRMLLYRTVVIGERAYRQGLLVSIPELAAWLDDRVLGAAELDTGVDLREGRAAASGWIGVEHRFAEPFGAVLVTLLLEPLPGGSGVRSLPLLAGATVLLTAVVFAALYRTTSVTWRYARRRQDFVSAVTHELKTPLTAIRLHAEMLRDGIVDAPEKRQRAYEVLTSESDRLSRLVDNVLELARLEKGSRAVHVVEGEPLPVLEEVVRVLGPHAEREGFDLRLDVPEGPMTARFDRDALLQILFNLVDNALKYGDGGGDRREILLRARAHPEDGSVVLTVADRGPGVPRRQLERIFEPFVRGGEELRRTTTGTGIGLALVRSLTEAMGATVVARRRSAGGLAVDVHLPAR